MQEKTNMLNNDERGLASKGDTELDRVEHDGFNEADFDDETVTNLWEVKTVSDLLREKAPPVGENESGQTNQGQESSKKSAQVCCAPSVNRDYSGTSVSVRKTATL